MSFKVYYLDDETALLQLFAETFASDHIVVETFSSAEALLSRVNDVPPDLLLLDFRLPHISGPEVAAKIDPAIPKILMTGDLTMENCAGFVAVLEKPASMRAVKALIDRYRVS